MEFRDKHVVITGGSSGIGLASARKFLEEGAWVFLTGRDKAKIDKAVAGLSSDRCRGFMVDVSNNEDMLVFFNKIRNEFHTIDVLFANAGVNGMWCPLEYLPVEEWDKTHAINTRGTFLTIKYAIPMMKANGGAIIINSSVNGTRIFSNKGASPYASSKSAQTTLGKMAALELAQHNIRVNIICPGPVNTNINDHTSNVHEDKIVTWHEHPHGFIPLGPGKIEDPKTWGQPEQVAAAVLFLAGSKASFITGSELWVDGAQSLIM
jgi:NAD(P)-dependent dehydrogenase (short-subunit alcohol dehydrogenase family)